MNKIKLYSSYAVIGLLLFGMAAFAYGEYQEYQKVINVAGDYIEAPVTQELSPTEQELFGSSVLPTKWFKQGNRVTYIESGTLVDATTSFISILNPFDHATSTSDEGYNITENYTSTSTVISINLDITGAPTSTTRIVCGAAATRYSWPAYQLFNLTITTGTIGVFENNQATTTGGFRAIGTDAIDKILLTHDYSYFNCVASATPRTAADYWSGTTYKGITGDTNTFDGTYSIEFRKNLKH